MQKLIVPQFEKRPPAAECYEIDGEFYSLDELLELASRSKHQGRMRRTVYEVLTGLHLIAGLCGCLFLDAVTRLWPLLAGIGYCFLAAAFFGILASMGGDGRN